MRLYLEDICREEGFGPEEVFDLNEKGLMIGRLNKQRRVVPQAELEKLRTVKSRMNGN